MNNYVLFVGGIILGILLSLTLVQHDGAAVLRDSLPVVPVDTQHQGQPKGHPSGQSRHVGGEMVHESNLRVAERALSGNAKASALHPHALLSKDRHAIEIIHRKKDEIRWAPGKDGSLDRYKKEAADAQASMLPGGARKPSLDDMMSQLSEGNFNDTKLQLKILRKMKKQSAKDADAGVVSAPVKISPSIAEVRVVNTPPNTKLPAYHEQCQRDFKSYIPFVPTLETETQAGRPGPDMGAQRAAYERENLKLHLCNGVFEAYSAAYLTTKQHMIEEPSDRFNLTWVNCEMASFVYMRQSNRFYKNADLPGIIMQTLDVLDFSVIHLSAYERSNKKHIAKIWPNRAEAKKYWSRVDNIVYTGKVLRQLNDPKVRTRSVHYSPEALRTVVLMPFLGGAMGAGHSELGNRFEYLKTCFWSLFEFFPHIVVAVARAEDVQWAWNSSGLPFYDVLLLNDLPKSAGLPVGSTQMLRQKLIDGTYDFDYVFYTESDQILIARELQMLYQHLKQHPGHMLLPHRLMPYSAEAMVKGLQRTDIIGLAPELFNTTRADEGLRETGPMDPKLLPPHQNKWMTQSCCLPRQNCQERKSWKNVMDSSVPVIQYYGMYVPLGNVNFLREDYRHCTLGDYVGSYCP